MTLTFELGLDIVKLNQHGKYLSQWSVTSYCPIKRTHKPHRVKGARTPYEHITGVWK